MSKVLLVTEEWAGSGHRIAALALRQALVERQAEVTIIGGLAAASPFLRQVSRLTYLTSLRHAPRAWQWVYAREAAWSGLLQKPLGRVLSTRLLRNAIERLSPEAVVSTHSYCLSALAEAKRRASRPFRLAAVLTDYHVNRFWLHPDVDLYVVPHPGIAQKLVDLGMDAGRVHASGIPVRPAFTRSAARPAREWREALGLEREVYTVLVCGGEGGYGDLPALVRRLAGMEDPLQIVAVTGRNDKLRRLLESEREKWMTGRARVRVLGYAEAMWEWMGAADTVITKPGGLTCSEALAMGKRLLLYQPLPGQERHNSRFLQEWGAAVEAATPDEAAVFLQRWIHEGQGQPMSAPFLSPDSAYKAADAILDITSKREDTC